MSLCRYKLLHVTIENILMAWVSSASPFSFPSSLSVYKGSWFSKVSAHTQQQQDVHSEQIEAEQQRGALTGAEGHSEHPHQAWATSTSLQGYRRRSAHKSSSLQTLRWQMRRRSTLVEPYPSDGSFRRLDENSGLWLICLFCRVPFSLAMTNNNNKNRC